MPACRSSTASSMARRLRSKPVASRRGDGRSLGAHQRLHLDQQRARALDGARDDRARRAELGAIRPGAAGSSTASRPELVISSRPTSLVEPKRFLAARSTRRPAVRSPSTSSTTSTRCSSTRGPATAPSLVTWPTSTIVIAVLLGDSQEAPRRLAHLGHRARRRGEVGRPQRLDGVDDRDGGALGREGRRDDVEIGLGHDRDAGRRRRCARRAGAPGPATPRPPLAAPARAPRCGPGPWSAASTCRRRDRRRPARASPARGRRRARGRARRRRSRGGRRRPWARRPARSDGAARSRRRAASRARRAPPPATTRHRRRGSGRATWPARRRTPGRHSG